MSTKSTSIGNQDFPADDFAQVSFDEFNQDSFDEVSQDMGGDLSQDSSYDEFAQYEVPEIVKPQRKKS